MGIFKNDDQQSNLVGFDEKSMAGKHPPSPSSS